MRTLVRIIVAAITLLAVAVPAQAGDTEVFESDPCSRLSHWTLELDLENRIEADFEGHTPRAGQTWRIVMRHNGSVVWRGTRTTEHDGDFEVEKTVRDRSGTDTIRVRSVNERTDEVCKGSASI